MVRCSDTLPDWPAQIIDNVERRRIPLSFIILWLFGLLVGHGMVKLNSGRVCMLDKPCEPDTFDSFSNVVNAEDACTLGKGYHMKCRCPVECVLSVSFQSPPD